MTLEENSADERFAVSEVAVCKNSRKTCGRKEDG